MPKENPEPEGPDFSRANKQQSRSDHRPAGGRSEARRAKRLIQLPLFLPLFIFFKNSPKIACQVPKSPKPNKQHKFELAF
jgi:hypothetical protein